MRSFTPKIIVSAFGGTGSSFFLQFWRANECVIWPRPDYPFSWGLEPYCLDAKIDWLAKFRHVNNTGQLLLDRTADWFNRTGREPQGHKTIRENLVEFLEETPDTVLLFGKQSLTEPFLTNHKISNALFVVRHPLDSYDSLFGRRHTAWAKSYGGVQSILNAENYALKWNMIVSDFLSCREICDTPIVRYETLVDDLRAAGIGKLARVVEPHWHPTMKREFITPQVEEFIKQITDHNFKQLYKEW